MGDSTVTARFGATGLNGTSIASREKSLVPDGGRIFRPTVATLSAKFGGHKKCGSYQARDPLVARH